MVVNKLFFILVVSIFTIVGHAEEIDKNHAINIFLDKEVKYALTHLGEKIEMCNKEKETNTLAIPFQDLQELNITIEQFSVATMTLNYRNNTQCIEKEEGRLIYQFLMQYKENKAQGKVEKDALGPILMSLPSHEVLDALSRYDMLPTKIREYFENTIGLKPFDIVRVSLPILEAFRK